MWSEQSVEYLPRLNGYAVELLQFCVFRFGLLQDGNVGVGVFPQIEEVLVGRSGFGRFALHGVRTFRPEASQHPPGRLITSPQWPMNFWNSAAVLLPS